MTSSGNPAYKVRIEKAHFEAMVAHAQNGLPNETCGLIAGRVERGAGGEGVKVVEKVYFMTNIDASSEHFSMDPREQLSAIKDMRANGLALLGNFHSHPETPARPSAEDIRLAYDPSASYLILSLAGDGEDPVLRAFHIENGIASPEEVMEKGTATFTRGDL
ncbi:MAG: M67 family metallopeptidase [Synergistaceae bacterium]|jgi:proteasome lid subunit RPN8/RPN11|nr:M67 family metallopeptidase [Synergistaceae bacterium]